MTPVSTRRRLRVKEIRAVALVAAGAVLISGHVGLALSWLGPLSVLPTVALGLAAVCFLLLLPSGNGGGHGILIVVATLLVTGPAWINAGEHEYATDKVAALATIVLPLLVVTAFCVRRVDDVEWLLHGVFALAVVGVLVAFIDLTSGVDIGMRGSDNAGYLNPIAAGRLAGSVILWLVFGRVRALPLSVRAGLSLMCAAVILGAASRGPLLALIVAVGVTALASRALRGRLAVAAIAVGLALTAGVGNSVLHESGDRILAGGDEGGAGSRSALWADATEAIQIWPEGAGWGQFSEEGLVGALAEYPHNLLLELALEAGVLAAACFLLLIVATIRKLWFSIDDYGPGFLAMLVFWLVSAMFSSDVNGNRVPIVLLIGLFAGIRSEIADRADAEAEADALRPTGGMTPVTHPEWSDIPDSDSMRERSLSLSGGSAAHD